MILLALLACWAPPEPAVDPCDTGTIAVEVDGAGRPGRAVGIVGCEEP